MTNFKWFSDPAHAWLRASKKEVAELGVKPTPYSYFDAEYIYLEEDVDAWKFIKAWEEANGKDFPENLPESRSHDQSIVRSKASIRFLQYAQG